MSASLDELVNTLSRDSFRQMRKHLVSNGLLLAKGIFPYQWFNTLDKLYNTELPPINAFYSELNEDGITEVEYARAQEV